MSKHVDLNELESQEEKSAASSSSLLLSTSSSKENKSRHDVYARLKNSCSKGRGSLAGWVRYVADYRSFGIIGELIISSV